MHWMLMPLRRYAEFSGRSRRKEYWMFFLFTVLVNIGFSFLSTLVGGTALMMGGTDPSALAGPGGGVGKVAAGARDIVLSCDTDPFNCRRSASST